MTVSGATSYAAYLEPIFQWGFGSPAFFNTLLYSVSLAINSVKVTPDALMYKGQAIRSLNEDLRDPTKTINEASMATIIALANCEVSQDVS